MNPNQSSDAILQEITINAPADRIFEAIINPNERVKWWGTKGRFQATHMESDLRPGGKWKMSGTGMGDKPFTIVGTYQEIDPPRLLVSTWLADWHEDAPETIVRFELEEADGATTVRLTHSGFTTDSQRENYRGWGLLLSLLQGYVTGRS